MNTDLLYIPMKRLHPAILAAVLLLSVTGAVQAQTPAAPAAPQVAGAISASHAAAVRSLLEALRLNLAIRHALKTGGSPDSPMREVILHMEAHVSDDEILRRLTQIYVKYLSEDDARQLVSFYSSDVGKRYVTALLARDGVIKGETHPQFSAQQMLELQQGAVSPASLKLKSVQDQINADSQKLGRDWGREYYQLLLSQFKESMRELLVITSAIQPDEAALPYTPKLIGLRSLDNLMALVADMALKTRDISRAYLSDMDSYQIELILSADRLVSAEGIARSKVAVAKSSDRVEVYLHDIDKLLQGKRQQLMDLVGNKKNELQMIEGGLAARYDFMVRLGENQRSILDVCTRILRWSESRLGTVHLQDGGLVFQSAEDLKMYESLMAQLKKTVEEENGLNSEAKASQQQALKKLDS